MRYDIYRSLGVKGLKPSRSYSYSSFQILRFVPVYVFRVIQTANNNYFHKIHSIKHLVFVMEMDWVICEVGTGFLYRVSQEEWTKLRESVP